MAVCLQAPSLTFSHISCLAMQPVKHPVVAGLVGGLLIGGLGVLLPPTMFWGEYEIQSLANHDQALPHIWPKGGVWGTTPFLSNR